MKGKVNGGTNKNKINANGFEEHFNPLLLFFILIFNILIKIY